MRDQSSLNKDNAYKIIYRLKIVALKCYGHPEKHPQEWKREKKIAAVQYIFQVTNELPFVLSKRTFYTAKEKWLKEYKTI